MSEILSPGYEFESMFTANDLSYTVQVRFVGLQKIMWGIRHSYSESDRLLKYSKAKYSPVSPDPSNHIRLATPFYYQELEAGKDSKLIADDLKGAHIELINWKNRGSMGMETLKKNIKASLPGVRYNLNAKITWARKDFWMYCASIDPNISYKRKNKWSIFPPTMTS